MAKRKLSEKDREAVRNEIGKRLAAGEPRAAVLRTISKKYKIATESARWYLPGKDGSQKKAKGAARPAATSPGRGRRKAQAPVKPKKTSSRSGTKPTSYTKPHTNGSSVRMVDVVQSMSVKDLERALEARKLLPQVEAARLKARKLRQESREAERGLAHLDRRYRSLMRSR